MVKRSVVGGEEEAKMVWFVWRVWGRGVEGVKSGREMGIKVSSCEGVSFRFYG